MKITTTYYHCDESRELLSGILLNGTLIAKPHLSFHLGGDCGWVWLNPETKRWEFEHRVACAGIYQFKDFAALERFIESHDQYGRRMGQESPE